MGLSSSAVLWLLSLAVAVPVPGADERDESPWFVRASASVGRVFPSTGFVEGANRAMEPIDRMGSFKLELGYQTDGSSSWERVYHRPSLGVGLFHADFGNDDELGRPTAVYGWFSWPFWVPGERFRLTTDFGLGAAFGFQPLDEESNPLNTAITTPASFYAEWGVYGNWMLSRSWELSAGGVFTHFSNGGTGDPNGAINTFGPVVRARFNFGAPPRAPAPTSDSESPSSRPWEIALLGGAGFKNVDLARDDPDSARALERFGVTTLGVLLQKRVAAMSRVGVGVDVVLDRSADQSLNAASPEPGLGQQTAIGFLAAYEQVIHRFSVPVQLGYYVRQGRSDERVPSFFQKLGFRYDLHPRIFVGMEARFFELSRADFIAWNVGIRLALSRGP